MPAGRLKGAQEPAAGMLVPIIAAIFTLLVSSTRQVLLLPARAKTIGYTSKHTGSLDTSQKRDRIDLIENHHV